WSTDAGPFQQHKPGLSSLRWALGRRHGVLSTTMPGDRIEFLVLPPSFVIYSPHCPLFPIFPLLPLHTWPSPAAQQACSARQHTHPFMHRAQTGAQLATLTSSESRLDEQNIRMDYYNLYFLDHPLFDSHPISPFFPTFSLSSP
ncbi:hypothetical protein KUCAC02_012263, partial [Chaenocephalus aceratus]